MRQLFTTLGLKIPIVQAPMGGAVPVRLAAAVSNAGALGTLPLWRADLETLRGTVRKMRGFFVLQSLCREFGYGVFSTGASRGMP